MWGFAEWFECRLKPIREQLRGPEAKGVNIINFFLSDSAEQLSTLDEWLRWDNTFKYDALYDLDALSKCDRLEAIEQLMQWATPIALEAPWPQAVAVGRALEVPLSQQEKDDLLPYLQWPRGDIKRKRR